MQEIFATVVAIWIIWKLFSAFSRDTEPRKTTQQFYQTNHNHYHQKQEGDVIIQQNQSERNRKPKSDSETEYTDYEEIK